MIAFDECSHLLFQTNQRLVTNGKKYIMIMTQNVSRLNLPVNARMEAVFSMKGPQASMMGTYVGDMINLPAVHRLLERWVFLLLYTVIQQFN